MRMKLYNLLAQCKPALTLVVATMIYSSSANAYQIVTDEALFQSLFQDPTHIIDFTHLKDGSTYENAFPSPLVRYWTTENYSYYGGGHYGVRQDAWSDDVHIGSVKLDCGCAWETTDWIRTYSNSYYITPTFYDRLYILNPSNTSPAFPVAINTSAGFIGFIPDNAVDGYYLLNPGVTISSVQYGFSAAAVPEPATYVMMLAGLGLIGVMARRR